jgi:hypothetical protein
MLTTRSASTTLPLLRIKTLRCPGSIPQPRSACSIATSAPGGRQKLVCRYGPSSPSAPTESYSGEITTIGLDIGGTSGGKLAWAVFMPTNGPAHGARSGGGRCWCWRQRLGRWLQSIGDLAAVFGRG